MEIYGKILIIAMPCFLALIIIEKLYGYYKGVDYAHHLWILYQALAVV